MCSGRIMRDSFLYLLALVLACLLISCDQNGTISPRPGKDVQTLEDSGEKVPPSSTATQLPTASPSPSPTVGLLPPTSSLTLTPTPSTPVTKTSIPDELLMADFDSCKIDVSDLGLPMGVTYTETLGTKMVFSHLQNADGSCSAKIDYTIYDWGGVWFELENFDLRDYDILAFEIRLDNPESTQFPVKAELKKECVDIDEITVCEQGVAKIYFLENSQNWNTVQMRFEHFGPDGVLDEQITSWDNIDQLVLVFTNPDQDSLNQDSKPITGTIYIDNVFFLKQNQSSQVEDNGLTIANFDSCMHVNNLGGPMGIATSSGDELSPAFMVQENGSCVLQLEYHMKDAERSWVAYWMELNQAKTEDYDTLVFDIRAEPHGPTKFVQGIKIELTGGCNTYGCKYRSIYYMWKENISTEWQTIPIPFHRFQSPGWAPGIEKEKIEEVIFTFECRNVGPNDIIYIDNIHFKKS